MKVSALLPAEKAGAEAELSQAEVELAKTIIRAGVAGRVEQFALRVGDIVNPLMRPAGVLIPEGAGRRSLGRLRADRGSGHEDRHGGRGYLRIEALGRHSDGGHRCPGLHCRWPVPRRRTADRRTAGRATGDHPVLLEPLYAGGLEGVIPGSSCIVNAYSSNHELLASSPDMSTTKRLVLHGVDAVGLVHALLLRIQALVLPIQTLVFSGH